MVKLKLVLFLIAIFLMFLINSVQANEKIYNKNINTIYFISRSKYYNINVTFLSFSIKNKAKIIKKLIEYKNWKNKFIGTSIYINNNFIPKLNNNVYLTYFNFNYLKPINYRNNISFFYQNKLTDILYKLKSKSNLNKNLKCFYSHTFRFKNKAKNHKKKFLGLLKRKHFNIKFKKKHIIKNKLFLHKKIGRGHSFFVNYKLKILNLNSHFSKIYRIDTRNIMKPRGNKANIWSISFKINSKPLYFGLSYSETQNSLPSTKYYVNRTKNIDVLGQLRLYDGILKPTVSFSISRSRDVNRKVNKEFEVRKSLSLGNTIVIKKNVSVYIEYKFNYIKSNSRVMKPRSSKKQTISLGISYKF